MNHIIRLGILLLSASAITFPLAQTMYKSIAPDGRIVYSNEPPTEGRIEKTWKFEAAPSSALPASTASYIEQQRRLKPSSSAAAPAGDVVLYSAAWCGYCRQAKAYLAGKGIAYREFDVETREGSAAFARAGGGRGIPLLLAGSQRVQGFSLAAYDQLFANRK